MLGIYAFWETDFGQLVFFFIHIALVYSILVLNDMRLKWRDLYKKQAAEALREVAVRAIEIIDEKLKIDNYD